MQEQLGAAGRQRVDRATTPLTDDGWPRIAVYDGGWLEWAQDPSNPIEVGDPSDSSQDADRQPT